MKSLTLGIVSCFLLLPGLLQAADPAPAHHFTSPAEAAKAFTAAVKSGNRMAVDEILGPGANELLSGDARQDAIEFNAFAQKVGQYSRLVKKSDDRFVLDVGSESWPFPVPIVRKDGAWFFDTAAGKDEIINRRIGEDEITAIGVCRTFVQAERDYASEDRDGDGILQYASKMKSTAGMKDGLYWPETPNAEQSPLGPLVAQARTEGYGPSPTDHPEPFHGYRFKVLTAQGAAAPGGAYNYIINGNLIGGFALVAYPAHWGESGVMTFLVNQWGKVYQCNLGPQSAELGAAMTEFNPDSAWTPVAP